MDTAGAGPAPPTLPDSLYSLQGLLPWDDWTHPGAPGLGHGRRPEQSHCQERCVAQRGAPEEPAQTVTPVAPSATTREPGGPLCPACPGSLACSPCSAPRRRCQGPGGASRACSCRGCTGCGGSGPAGPPSRSRRPAGRVAHQRGADMGLPTQPDTPRPGRAEDSGARLRRTRPKLQRLLRPRCFHELSDSRGHCVGLCPLCRPCGLSDSDPRETAPRHPGGVQGGP